MALSISHQKGIYIGIQAKLGSGFMAWTLGLWTLGPRKFFPFLVTSISFFLLFNAEFFNISNDLRLMYYVSAERGANGYYNANLLQSIL